jgi:CheY-like chemotaxis protein
MTGSTSPHRFLLVADSNARSLFYTTTLLQRLQYNVWTAQSGEEAVEMATTAVPALIIAAQSLKDMPGLELIRRLKRSDITRPVPVIVIGRKMDPADERACLAAGAVTVLSTPIRAENLYRVIQVALEQVPRMNLRISTRLSVTINDNTVRCSEGECASVLSEHGVYVRTPDPHPLNAKLPVRIRLGDGEIAADAVVIYSNKTGNEHEQPGMGLQFVRISERDQERIRTFIREELTRDFDSR